MGIDRIVFSFLMGVSCFGVWSCWTGETFLPNVDDIIVEQSRYLEEIRRASIKFLTIEAVVESLEYPGTLVEKVQLLAREVSEKNEISASFMYFYPR